MKEIIELTATFFICYFPFAWMIYGSIQRGKLNESFKETEKRIKNLKPKP